MDLVCWNLRQVLVLGLCLIQIMDSFVRSYLNFGICDKIRRWHRDSSFFIFFTHCRTFPFIFFKVLFWLILRLLFLKGASWIHSRFGGIQLHRVTTFLCVLHWKMMTEWRWIFDLYCMINFFEIFVIALFLHDLKIISHAILFFVVTFILNRIILSNFLFWHSLHSNFRNFWHPNIFWGI